LVESLHASFGKVVEGFGRSVVNELHHVIELGINEGLHLVLERIDVVENLVHFGFGARRSLEGFLDIAEEGAGRGTLGLGGWRGLVGVLGLRNGKLRAEAKPACLHFIPNELVVAACVTIKLPNSVNGLVNKAGLFVDREAPYRGGH
jgi:hypothetical protein